MADITSIPAAQVPLLEPDSRVMSREWYRFLFNQFGQTGSGTTDISISDLALAPFSDAETEATLDLMRADIQGLSVAPPVVLAPRRSAAFANSAAQTPSGANTATIVTFNTTVFSQGIGLATSSMIMPACAGAYRVSFTAQLDKTSGGDALVYFWLRKNNATDLANTAKRWRIRGNDAEVVFCSTMTVVLEQTDFLQMMWAADNANVTLDATAATAFSPAGPSSLLSIAQVD
jgi:hypothetical protein